MAGTQQTKRSTVTFDCPETLARRLAIYAATTGEKKYALIIEAIEQYLDRGASRLASKSKG